jgi:hypothetical protein
MLNALHEDCYWLYSTQHRIDVGRQQHSSSHILVMDQSRGCSMLSPSLTTSLHSQGVLRLNDLDTKPDGRSRAYIGPGSLLSAESGRHPSRVSPSRRSIATVGVLSRVCRAVSTTRWSAASGSACGGRGGAQLALLNQANELTRVQTLRRYGLTHPVTCCGREPPQHSLDTMIRPPGASTFFLPLKNLRLRGSHDPGMCKIGQSLS